MDENKGKDVQQIEAELQEKRLKEKEKKKVAAMCAVSALLGAGVMLVIAVCTGKTPETAPEFPDVVADVTDTVKDIMEETVEEA